MEETSPVPPPLFPPADLSWQIQPQDRPRWPIRHLTPGDSPSLSWDGRIDRSTVQTCSNVDTALAAGDSRAYDVPDIDSAAPRPYMLLVIETRTGSIRLLIKA